MHFFFYLLSSYFYIMEGGLFLNGIEIISVKRLILAEVVFSIWRKIYSTNFVF